MVSRVLLPAEFYDITSSMMLVAPTPEFTYAKLLYASDTRAQFMASDITGFLSAMPRGPRSSGAAVPDLQDMQLSLAKSIMAEAVTAVPELEGRGIGHTVRINRPQFAGGGYTLAARRVGSSQSISTTPIDVAAEQAMITIHRHVGPYAAGGTQPQPYSIDRLDSGKSVHQLAGVVGLHMQYDRWRWVDAVIASLMDSAVTHVQRAGNLTADSQFPVGNEVPVDLEMLLRAEERMRAAGIPRFSDGTYGVVLSTRQMRQLRLDPQFSRQSKFVESQNVLLNSSVVRVGESLSIMESATVPTDTTTVAGATIHRGVMFGPGALGYALDEPCRVASSNDDNYGETAKVIWVAYEGFSVLDERFMCSLRSA
jgi:hypothetical protein